MFILVVNVLDWRKNKKLDISDQLISGLSALSLIHRISQISFRCTAFIHGNTIFLRLSIALMHLSVILCTLLFSTLIAIHFCLKIVNINQNFYICIQRTFPKLFPWILLLLFLASFFISGPVAENMSKQFLNSTNVLLQPRSSPLKALISLKLYFVFTSFCFLIIVISLLITVVSLYRHIHRIQNNANNFRSETVEAHVTAVKTLISLLCLDFIYFFLLFVIVLKRHSFVWMNTVTLLLAIWHALGSLILIRGSSKLKKMLLKMWHHCTSML
ncbi:hypothetical protein GDO78_018438, partial [Eleutherodactylus coqui]